MIILVIFLLLAVVAVGISGLYVAFTLNSHAEEAAKPLIKNAVTEISGKIDAILTGQGDEHERQQEARELLTQMDSLISDVKDQGAKTQGQLGRVAGQVEAIASRLTAIELRTAGLAAAKTSSGEIPVTKVTDANNPLTVAVLEAESDRHGDDWGMPPQLYALVGKAVFSAANPELGAGISAAQEDALIPVKQQKQLPKGAPLEALARVSWPADVAGCVLVTELVVLPPETEGERPPDPDEVEQWARDHPGGRPARLAVGVSRNGDYTCVLRLKGEDSVRLDPRLADDLVTALLATF